MRDVLVFYDPILYILERYIVNKETKVFCSKMSVSFRPCSTGSKCCACAVVYLHSTTNL